MTENCNPSPARKVTADTRCQKSRSKRVPPRHACRHRRCGPRAVGLGRSRMHATPSGSGHGSALPGPTQAGARTVRTVVPQRRRPHGAGPGAFPATAFAARRSHRTGRWNRSAIHEAHPARCGGDFLYRHRKYRHRDGACIPGVHGRTHLTVRDPAAGIAGAPVVMPAPQNRRPRRQSPENVIASPTTRRRPLPPDRGDGDARALRPPLPPRRPTVLGKAGSASGQRGRAGAPAGPSPRTRRVDAAPPAPLRGHASATHRRRCRLRTAQNGFMITSHTTTINSNTGSSLNTRSAHSGGSARPLSTPLSQRPAMM